MITDPPPFDLAIDLPAHGSRQVGRDLHRQLRSAIVGGRLQPGVRLPATRELAAALEVSRNTVVTAYDLLLSEGYVRAQGRGGTLVADFLSPPSRAERTRVEPARDARLSPAWRTPSSLIAIGRPEGCRFDFSVGIPDWESFPLAVCDVFPPGRCAPQPEHRPATETRRDDLNCVRPSPGTFPSPAPSLAVPAKSW